MWSAWGHHLMSGSEGALTRAVGLATVLTGGRSDMADIKTLISERFGRPTEVGLKGGGETLTQILNHRSIRKYQDKEVSEEGWEIRIKILFHDFKCKFLLPPPNRALRPVHAHSKNRSRKLCALEKLSLMSGGVKNRIRRRHDDDDHPRNWQLRRVATRSTQHVSDMRSLNRNLQL